MTVPCRDRVSYPGEDEGHRTIDHYYLIDGCSIPSLIDDCITITHYIHVHVDNINTNNNNQQNAHVIKVRSNINICTCTVQYTIQQNSNRQRYGTEKSSSKLVSAASAIDLRRLDNESEAELS